MGTIFQRLAPPRSPLRFGRLHKGAPGQAPTGQPTSAPTAGAPQPTVVSQPTTAGAAHRRRAADCAGQADRPAEQAAGLWLRPAGWRGRHQGRAGGWDFAPGSDVAVRLGLPNPVGEALTSARVDAAGRWSGSFVLPGELPSGDPVPAGQVTLMVMDANTNAALASAPFGFEPPAGPAARRPARPSPTSCMRSAREGLGLPGLELNHSLPLEQSLGLRHLTL